LDHNRNLGKIGENIAIHYLKDKGFSIRERNWRYKHKEIDIIAEDNGTLIIVEVKTRGQDRNLYPGDIVPNSKQRYLINAADAYIRKHEIETETRFDIIFVFFDNNLQFEVQHIERAFYPTL